MSHELSEDMRRCIENCTNCRNACLETIDHCLRMGGKHADADHLRLMMDCAEICSASASFMLRGSPFHTYTCGVCAEVCARCAEDCERLAGEDSTMQRCAEVCRRCAESCQQMAQMAA